MLDDKFRTVTGSGGGEGSLRLVREAGGTGAYNIDGGALAWRGADA